MDDKLHGASSSHSQTQITDLSVLLIIDILSRLTVKSLLSCKRVCKTWLSLLSDPLFIKLQLSRSPTCILIRHVAETRRFRFVQIVREIAADRFEAESMEFQAGVNLPYPEFDFESSCCNGLLCLIDCSSISYQQIIYVCNPFLGEYISIPAASKRGTNDLAKFALGFSSTSSQFKVLQISYSCQNDDDDYIPYMIEIYTIGNGTGQWRSIEVSPFCPQHFFDLSLSLHGSIHWVASPVDHHIAYFDFDSERFASLPLPYSQCDGEDFELVKFGALDECLWVSFVPYHYPPELEIWVMKEYGVEESWVRMFSFNSLHNKSCNFRYLELLYLVNNHELLIFHHEGGMVCYDGRSNLFLDTNAVDAAGYSVGTAYCPCFVSLKDVAEGEELTVLPRTSGNWDVKTQVPHQCKVSQMKLPPYFMEWINLKDVYLSFYRPKKEAKGMRTMMEQLKLPMQGSHHLGIDDTKNIGRVLVRMIADGAILPITAWRNPVSPGNVSFLYRNRRGRVKPRGLTAESSLWKLIPQHSPLFFHH